MKGRSPTFTQIPLNIVGSTVFGRYPKISVEQTYNMIISDNFLVPFAGHRLVTEIDSNGTGRAIFTSTNSNHMYAVINNGFYSISSNLEANFIHSISTFSGDVYIDENNANQIAICDRQNIYIYDYVAGTFDTVDLSGPDGFIPGYISFQNERFIAAALGTSTWRLSALSNGNSWPNDTFHVGTFQTKPDTVTGAQRFPGRGNLLFVFGSTVTEAWQDAGLNLFPYLRNNNFNVDYGCLNPATIAYNDTIIVWLAANEKSGPVIMYSTGGDPQKISTDGIDFQLSRLTNPSDSFGFLFRQDGHLLYQLTFEDDNLTYLYDFNTKKFFTLCDKNMDAHIAKRVAFYNDKYYFVSTVDGNIYELSTDYSTYDGEEIPRIRVCRNIRLPDASRFSVNNLTFTIEQGTQDTNLYPGFNVTTTYNLITEDEKQLITEDVKNYILDEFSTPFPYIIKQQVGLSVSKNGGQSFGSVWSKNLNEQGLFRNRLIYWNLGACNDFVPQFRFWGLSRFVCTDGIVSIFQ